MRMKVMFLALLTSLVVAMSVTSCINDDLADRQDPGAGKIAALEDQAAAIEASVADIEALQTALGEGRDAGLEKSASALEDHVADLRAKAPFMDATMTTLALQKKLAEAVGAVLASDSNGDLAKHAAALEKGVKTWLGKHLTAYYPAALAQARTASAIASLDLKTRKLNVEAILSDVEAGLSAYEDVEGLSALAEKVNGNCETAASLAAELSALTEEVEAEYTKAVETVVSDPENFDAPAIKQFNAGVQTKAVEADNTLAGLISRVETCEAQLEGIKTRLDALKSKVDNLNELLGLIQSVTFMSEYSEEKAVAYYNLGTESRQDGKKKRIPEGTVDLKYIVRPASAAQALTVSDLWDSQVKVFGYYAQAITKAAPETFLDFDITNVTADNSGNGIVTVTVSAASLNDEFYFKETGAKLALSIATGKTDLTSKFVEIVPKDQSGTVYVEGIELSAKSIEIDNGQTANLTATLTPDNVTTDGVIWKSDDANVAFVSAEGVITAKSVGSTVITVTTNSTDEWGNQLTATCNVKVLPALKLKGPDYITEKGGTAELMLSMPENYAYDKITWTSSNNLWATVNDRGVVSGVTSILQDITELDEWYDDDGYHFEEKVVGHKYCEVTIECDIDGTKLTHKMQVVKVQPTAISIEGRNFNDNTITMKTGTELTLGKVSVYPSTVDENCFSISAFATMNSGISYDADTRKIKANYPGYSTISFSYSATYSEYWLSYQRPGRKLEVFVEPYYVTSLELDDVSMTPGQEAVLTPKFTSDTQGQTPSFTDLKWTSSDPTVVSIEEKTGKVNALKDGAVQITATTTHPDAVEGGGEISATCVITVKSPTVQINIGDYYYNDGTWGSDPDPDDGRSVIGVIFSKANAVASDPLLLRDYPNCSNGLVVGLVEYADQDFGLVSCQNGHGYYTSLGYDANAVVATDKVNGYGNTLAHRAMNGSRSDFCLLFNETDGVVATHSASVQTPSGASTWYVPSYKEMQMMGENLQVVNNAITEASGNTITAGGEYWSSTIYGTWYAKGNSWDHFKFPFVVSGGTNGWRSIQDPSGEHPVRVVLAF